MQEQITVFFEKAKVAAKVKVKENAYTIESIAKDEPNEEGFETKYYLHDRHGDDHDLTFLFTEEEEIHFQGVFFDGRQIDLKDFELL
jgi:hypothetical protein